MFHLQEKKIRDTQSSNGEPFGKILIFGFMAWLSLGKKFPGITLVGGDQAPGRGQWSIHFMESANCTIRSSAPSLASSQCCCLQALIGFSKCRKYFFCNEKMEFANDLFQLQVPRSSHSPSQRLRMSTRLGSRLTSVTRWSTPQYIMLRLS